MQPTACHAVHSVGRRLARRLMLARDHVERHEFAPAAGICGYDARRNTATMTVAAGMLQRAGLITCRRGHVTIVDRRAQARILRMLPDVDRLARRGAAAVARDDDLELNCRFAK
jgi:hypothetical protein